MRVAFDQQIFLIQRHGGISRYFCSMIPVLNNPPEIEAKIFAPLHVNHHLRDLHSPLVWGRYLPRFPGQPRVANLASRLIADAAVGSFRPDIFHETYFTEHDGCPPGAKRIITVYDMVSELFPALSQAQEIREIKRLAVNRADHVICISQNTRRDLIELFGIAENKVSVVYLAHYDVGTGPAGIDSSALPDRPYILYVGNRSGYKNFAGLAKAYAESNVLRSNLSLLCFGGGRFTAEEEQSMKELGMPPGRVFQVNGDDALLGEAYRRADVVVFPSLYEGMGFPPLEAMSAGCPAVVSNKSSIPEVVGDAAEYFDPYDSASIAHAIERVLASAELRKALIEKGHQRQKLYNWRRCADETLAVYRDVL